MGTLPMTQRQELLRALWLAVRSQGGRIRIALRDLEEYPGEDRVLIITQKDLATGDFVIEARIEGDRALGERGEENQKGTG